MPGWLVGSCFTGLLCSSGRATRDGGIRNRWTDLERMVGARIWRPGHGSGGGFEERGFGIREAGRCCTIILCATVMNNSHVKLLTCVASEFHHAFAVTPQKPIHASYWTDARMKNLVLETPTSLPLYTTHHAKQSRPYNSTARIQTHTCPYWPTPTPANLQIAFPIQPRFCNTSKENLGKLPFNIARNLHARSRNGHRYCR